MTKKAPAKPVQTKRSYNVVSEKNRRTLISEVESGKSCHSVAKCIGIGYNNAKMIVRAYRREGRVDAVPQHLKRLMALYKRDPNMKLDSRLLRHRDLMGYLEE